MTSLIRLVVLASLILCSTGTLASGSMRRFVVAAGANLGGSERVPLRYAVSDAEKFADVMTRMGGVDPADEVILREPTRELFEGALDDLRKVIAAARDEVRRTEVLLYYSGHADDKGLLLGDQRFTYRALRDKMDLIPADVRITVLDACASGAITRIKGGQRREAFLLDASTDMEGYAFLTSSSGDEGAQESDRIGASFFTHYLVSGMRGAADASGEGKVTLGEAYQFAFHETLSSTTKTQGGAQHPAYHINLSGTGDVVMTDIRQTSSGLILSEEIGGRFYIRNADQELVAEVYKPVGRRMELGLESGQYEIHLDQEPALLLAAPELGSGDRLLLQARHFTSVDRERTSFRGRAGDSGRPSPSSLMSGRHRIALLVGKWGRGPGNETSRDGFVTTSAGSFDLLAGFEYARWIREDLAFGFEFAALGGDATVDVGVTTSTRAVDLVSLLVSARKYFSTAGSDAMLRPFLTGGVGTYIGSESVVMVGPGVANRSDSYGAAGVQLGGGAGIPFSRHFVLDIQAAYNLVSDFREPIGGRKNYSGPELRFRLGWVFGKGNSENHAGS